MLRGKIPMGRRWRLCEIPRRKLGNGVTGGVTLWHAMIRTASVTTAAARPTALRWRRQVWISGNRVGLAGRAGDLLGVTRPRTKAGLLLANGENITITNTEESALQGRRRRAPCALTVIRLPRALRVYRGAPVISEQQREYLETTLTVGAGLSAGTTPTAAGRWMMAWVGNPRKNRALVRVAVAVGKICRRRCRRKSDR